MVVVCQRLLAALIVVALAIGAAVVAGGVAAQRPSNGEIAFTRIAAGHLQAIYVVGADGRGLRKLRTVVVPSSEPRWSPRGSWIAFRGGAEDDLYLIRPDGSRLQRLTADTAHESGAAWSPDGSRLAYTRSSKGSTPSIYIIELATRRVRRLTSGWDDLQPSWSPDGSTILFTRLDPRHYFRGSQIWTMSKDGSRQHPLLATRGLSDAVWSPAADVLLLSDGKRLYLDRPDRGAPTSLVTLGQSTSGEREDPAPSWSPDATRIIFDQFDRGLSEIWTVRSDGTSPKRVTKPSTGTLDSLPSWQPLNRHS